MTDEHNHKLDFFHETQHLQAGKRYVVGVDEVGRGPWAGPVTAAAVVLDPAHLPQGVRDSKKLTPQRREELFEIIMEKAHVSFGEASVAEIDQINIRQATFVAMQRAVLNLPVKPDYGYVDGRDLPGFDFPAQPVIKGDDHVLSIACASVVAKVKRDRFMQELHEEFPYYGWHSNAGYGTKAHQEGLRQYGVTEHHRRSFAPIKALLMPQDCQKA